MGAGPRKKGEAPAAPGRGAALGVLLVGPEPALGAREICGKTRLGATDACDKKLAKEAGVCQHTDKAGKKMRKKCKITCGLCDEVSPVPSPPPSPPPPPKRCEQKVAPDQHPCQKLAKQKKPSKIQKMCSKPKYQKKCAGQCDPECPLGYSFLFYAARPAKPNAFAEDGAPPPCQPCRARDYRNGAEYSDGDYFDGSGICQKEVTPGRFECYPADAHQWSLHGSSPAERRKLCPDSLMTLCVHHPPSPPLTSAPRRPSATRRPKA